MGESWHDRISERARQLWEREGRPHGRDWDHWQRAEDELWWEALTSATGLAERLNRMRRSLDEGTDEGLRTAAEIGCEAMKFLIEETDFAAQVRARSGRPPLLVWSPEAKAYFDDLELFEDFLAVERQILVRSGLGPLLADQIIAFLRGQIERLRSGSAGAAAAHMLDVAVYRACEARDAVRNRQPLAQPLAWYRRSTRGIWLAAGGGLVFVANIAAAAAINDVLGEVSKEVGSFIFGHAMGGVLP